MSSPLITLLATMGERFSLIESSTPRSTSGAGWMAPVFRIRPQVVDTSFLLPDVVRAARDGYLTKFLSAIQFGSVRPFAGHHVWAEVPRKIPERAARMGASPAAVEAIWWDEYVPRIRFVDVHGLAVPSPEILVRDTSDSPTVALAGLLGQVVVTAKDADLSDIGVAATDWIATVEAGYAISVAGGGAWGGLFTMRVGGYGLASAGRVTFRALSNPAGQFLLAAMVLGLFLTRRRWMPQARRWAENFWPWVDGMVEIFAPVVQEFVEQYRTGDASWNGALFESHESGALQRVAHLLASSPYPLNRTQMIRQLYSDATESERRTLMKGLAELLANYPAFVPVNSRDWQLGRSGMDFGRRPSEASLLHRRGPSLPFGGRDTVRR